MTEEEVLHCSIPGDMAKYVNENFDRILSGKDLKENIFKKIQCEETLTQLK